MLEYRLLNANKYKQRYKLEWKIEEIKIKNEKINSQNKTFKKLIFILYCLSIANIK